MDIARMLSEIGKLHACTVSLEMSPVGELGSGGLDISLCAMPSLGQNGGARRCVSLKLVNVPTEPGTMAARIYRLTHELDTTLLGEWWKQGELQA